MTCAACRPLPGVTCGDATAGCGFVIRGHALPARGLRERPVAVPLAAGRRARERPGGPARASLVAATPHRWGRAPTPEWGIRDTRSSSPSAGAGCAHYRLGACSQQPGADDLLTNRLPGFAAGV